MHNLRYTDKTWETLNELGNHLEICHAFNLIDPCNQELRLSLVCFLLAQQLSSVLSRLSGC